MSPLAIIYTITIIVAIAIAVLLARLARLSSQAKTGIGDKEIRQDKNIPADEHISKVLSDEMYDIVEPQKRQEVIQKVTEVFNKELEDKISSTTQELSKKYESIIDEKAHNEEIAWGKYKKALAEKKDTDAVIRSIAQGLIVVDSSGKVVMMNPAAEQLLGAAKKDKVGKHVLDNLKEEELVSLAKGSPEKEDREIELHSGQDETKKILRASTAVIENEHGQTVGMVSVLSDITKQKELDQLKAHFLATVSHELRTPLVAMDKNISLILSKAPGPLSEAQEQFLSIAQRNLKRLSRLIDDLLDLTKLEARKMEIRRKPSSIEKIIEESVESLSTWANTKSIAVNKNIQEGIPDINADPDRITQILNNLIGNAVKYTPNNGTISVEAYFSKEKNEVQVSVKDNGMGIDKENLAKVFDKFYQVGQERSFTDISGTGIGLSVAKEIVALHGGKIWAESEKGQGAKFIFTLPL